MSSFLLRAIKVGERVTETNPITSLKHQELTVQLEFISSGNTTGFSNQEVLEAIQQLVKEIEQK